TLAINIAGHPASVLPERLFVAVTIAWLQHTRHSYTDMASKKRDDHENSVLHYLKQICRCIYYASTMAIMLTAFDLYYEDRALIKREQLKDHKIPSSTPIYPWALVVLNMMVVVMIWCHFTYPKKTTV